MDHHGGTYASPWAAVLSHHGMPGTDHPGFATAAHAHHSNYSVPMDLHVPQSFSYYRCVSVYQ